MSEHIISHLPHACGISIGDLCSQGKDQKTEVETYSLRNPFVIICFSFLKIILIQD